MLGAAALHAASSRGGAARAEAQYLDNGEPEVVDVARRRLGRPFPGEVFDPGEVLGESHDRLADLLDKPTVSPLPPKGLDRDLEALHRRLVAIDAAHSRPATPRRLMERTEAQQIASAKSGPCAEIANKPYVTNLPYYHFIQGAVDFIYLDNASGSFSYPMEKPPGSYSRDQVSWFDCILERAMNNPSIATVVVGMHEALPYSRANDHSMCDDPSQKTEGCETGKHVYEALLKLHEKKNVYVLASHSHFYMDKLFDDQPSGHRLPGWIVGTAGAVRYPLPPHVDPGPGAQRDVYGYLLATVEPNGEIHFDFKEVKETDVPGWVRKRYSSAFPAWCFAHNSQNKDPISEETTNRCVGPVVPSNAGQKAGPSATKP